LIIPLVAALAVLVAPVTASAAQAYSDTISGYEYAFTSTDGRFAGTASGPSPVPGTQTCKHTRLCLSCTRPRWSPAAGFSLATAHNGFPALVLGAFVGGTVQVTTSAPTARIRRSPSRESLATSAGGRAAAAAARLRRHLPTTAIRYFGSCVTYGASIRGTLSLRL
jgi:hypothetical protein